MRHRVRMNVSEARSHLLTRAQLERSGLSPRQLSAAVADGTLQRVHRGWYVPDAVWRTAYTEARHLMRVVVTHERQRGTEAVFAFVSAAVLHGLPLLRLRPQRVHLSGARTNGLVASGDRFVARHEVEVPERDRVVIDGIPCTSLSRTVADVVRLAPEPAALAVADAALRLVAWDGKTRTYDAEADAAFRVDVATHLARFPRARGVRQARRVLAFADGRAESPAETLCRLFLRELGFTRLVPQVPVPAPQGGWFWLDLGLEGVPAWFEFDGAGKYTDPAMRGRLDLPQVLLAEKEREDWIRATTRRPLARAGHAHLASAEMLGERLARFQIFPA